MFNNNYHTHMRYCNHATGDVIDYVKAAIKYGFNELGMSDHAPIPINHRMTEEEFKDNYCIENMSLETFNLYLKQIDDCRLLFPNIKIYKALESEYLYDNDEFYNNLRSKLDYMILGVHFYSYNGRIINTYSEVNYDTVKGYLENVRRAFETNMFKYFAHPDLFLFDYKDRFGKNTFDDTCKIITKELIDLSVKHDIYFEINCNGLKFAKDKNNRDLWRYPNVKFWQIVKEYQDNNPNKLKVIIGADSHNPEDLYNDNVKNVLKFVDDLGLKVENKLEL